MGADLILVPTVNEKAEPLTIFEWEIRVQAFQNSVAIAMCNRVGTEADMQFAGESLVTDAYGNLICKAGDEEGVLYVEVDLKESSDLRNKKPYTQLRRTEDYNLGLDMSTFFVMTAKQAVREQGIPFKITMDVPNAETIQAMKDTKNKIGLSKGFSSVSELMEDLDADD